MLNYNIVRAVLSEPWYISTSEAEKASAFIYGLLTPNMEFEQLTPQARASLSYVSAVNGSDTSSDNSNIGIVTIRGALTKYDSLCAVGMQSYGEMIRSLDADSKIDAIILDIDSPGGSANGTEELAMIVKQTSKPTLAFINDLGCSAAYWIASACDQIIANNSTACVGSIGTMCTMTDMRDYYSKLGIKSINIYAPQSVNKNRGYRSALQGDYSIIKDELAVLADKFISAVRANRANIINDQLTGSEYFAKDVVGSLIDSIGSFNDALQCAANSAHASQSFNTNNNNTMSKPQFTTLAATAGISAIEIMDESISISVEQATAIDTSLVAGQEAIAEVTQLRADLAAAQTTIKEVNTSLVSANKTISDLQAQVQKTPGATSATVNPKVDSHVGEQKGVTSGFDTLNEAMMSALEYDKVL